MTTIQLELADDLASLLGADGQSIERAALELIVMELYRRRTISSGRAAELLGMRLEEFIMRSSDLGIPFFDMTPEELDEELRLLSAP